MAAPNLSNAAKSHDWASFAPKSWDLVAGACVGAAEGIITGLVVSIPIGIAVTATAAEEIVQNKVEADMLVQRRTFQTAGMTFGLI